MVAIDLESGVVFDLESGVVLDLETSAVGDITTTGLLVVAGAVATTAVRGTTISVAVLPIVVQQLATAHKESTQNGTLTVDVEQVTFSRKDATPTIVLVVAAEQVATGYRDVVTDGLLQVGMQMAGTVDISRATIGWLPVNMHLQAMIATALDVPTTGLLLVTATTGLASAVKDAQPVAALQVPAHSYAVVTRSAGSVALLTVEARMLAAVSKVSTPQIGQLQIVTHTLVSNLVAERTTSGALRVFALSRGDVEGVRTVLEAVLRAVTIVRLPALGDQFLSAGQVCVVWNDALYEVVTVTPVCEVVGVR